MHNPETEFEKDAYGNLYGHYPAVTLAEMNIDVCDTCDERDCHDCGMIPTTDL